MDPFYRQARSLQDLQNVISQLITKGVTIKFVKENLTFTRDNHDPFIKLLFDVLGSFAEFARNILRERQRKGIEKPRQQDNMLMERASEERVTTGQKFTHCENKAFHFERSQATRM